MTGFRVDHRAVGSATWTSGDVVTPTATQATITGLTDAVTYELRLVAINAAGAGAASATVTATPFRFTPGYTTATGAPLDMQAMTAGTVITMSGSGATPGATIVLELHSDPIVLGTTVVAADGTYRLTVTLPAGVTGSHTLVATMAGVAPVGTAVGVVSATAPAAAAATGTNATAASAAAARPAARSTVRSAALAATGTDPEPLAAAAWVLILAGAGALALARARRARPTR
ncbi:fibronectin type III domain-containing protein [Cellulomonas soli]